MKISASLAYDVLPMVVCTLVLAGAAARAQGGATAPAVRATDPRVLWKHAPEGSQWGAVVAGKGVVFALDRSGKVQALEAPTGHVQWTSEAGFGFGFGYGLALSPDPGFAALLVGCDTGMFALDLRTGAKIWHAEIPLGVSGPAATSDVVVAGGADGKIYGLELKSGKILWRHDYLEDRPEDPPGFAGAEARFEGRPARPGAAAAEGSLVVLPVFDQCRAIAVDARTGERRWAFQTKGWMWGRPAIGPRNVLVVSQDRNVYAIDKQSGKSAWQVATRGRNEGAAACDDRFVYFGSCDAHLYAVDDGVGKVVWRYETEHAEGKGAPIYSRPVVRGDTVYLAAMAGKVYAVNRQTGEPAWKFCPVPDAEIEGDMVEAGGLLFLTTRTAGGRGENAVLALTVR